MKQKLLNSFKLRVCLLVAVLCAGFTSAWGDVVSGTTYDTKAVNSLPTGWSGEDGDGTSYIKLTESSYYIQTSSFEQNGFTSITVKARKFGGPTDAQALITVSWYDASTSAETVLGTVAPTNTTLKDYTINSPANPTGNTTGYIKIQCKGAGSGKGSGVSAVTITYTAAGGSSAVATTTTIDDSGITNTDVYTSTAAGSLAATVTAGGNAVAGATVTWSSSDTNVATIASDGTVTLVAAGTVTFTASYAGVANQYQTSSGTYEMTVTSSAPDYATLPFAWEGGASSGLLALNCVTANGLGSDYAEGNKPYLIKLDGTGDYIQVKTDGQPGKVTIGVKMIGGATTSTITVQESADGETFTAVQALSISGAQNDVLSLETTNAFAATTRYVRLLFTKGSNVGVGPISIAVPTNDPAISAENVSIEYNVTSGSISYDIVHPVDGGVISAVSDEEWLTFTTGTAYTVTQNETINARTANVTLTYTYNSTNVSKVITFTQSGNPNAPGTQNNPYTVAQALAAEPNNGVYVQGIVCSVYSTSVTNNGQIRYYISDDGTENGDKLNVYNGLGLNGAQFTSIDDIQVGDEVVITGNLSTYSGANQLAQNNHLVSLHRNVVQEDGIIDIADANVTYGTSYTIDTENDVLTDGELTITVTNPAIASVNGTTITPLAVGSTTITVTSAATEAYTAATDEFTLTVSAPVGSTSAPTASLGGTIFQETFDGFIENSTHATTQGGNDNGQSTGNDIWSGNAGATSFNTVSDNCDESDWNVTYGGAGYQCAKFGSSKNAGSAKTRGITVENGKSYNLSFKAAPWNDESTTISVTVEGGKITGISDDAMSIKQWNNLSATIEAESSIISLTFSASNNRFFLDEVEITEPSTPAPAITAKLSATTGYATFCSQYPLDFSDYATADYSAWQITDISTSNVITFEQVTDGVKGGTGLLLKGTAGATVTLTSADCNTELSGNLLEGTLAPTYVTTGDYYGLSGQTFVKVNAGTVPAGKALLPASEITTESSGAKAFTFVFEGADGIKTVEKVSAEEAAEIFNLAGQRLQKAQRGVNIINGKKVLVK